MGRLIDADDLIEHIKKYKFGAITNDSEREYTREVMLCFVNGISTAYSVEWVVAEFEEMKLEEDTIGSRHHNTMLDICIDIVKRGGVDERT